MKPGVEPSRRRLPTGLPKADESGAEAPLERSFAELVDDDRREGARRELQQRELRRIVERDQATFVGALRDLAEQALPVVVDHVGGRTSGLIVRLGEDHVGLRSSVAGELVLVSLWAIGAVATSTRSRVEPADGWRPAAAPEGLRDVLADLVEEQPEVVVVVAGRAEALGARLRAVGQDLLTLSEMERPASTLVPLNSVVAITIRH